MLDLNRNGIPDYREPWLYRLGLKLVAWAIRSTASPHTLAARHVDAAERMANQVLDTVEAPPVR